MGKTNISIQDIDKFVCEEITEQETLISWDRTEDRFTLFTSDNTMLTKLKKICAQGADQWVVERVSKNPDGSFAGVTVSAPLNCVSLRAGNKREMTDEQRQELAERMRQINKK